MGFTLGGLGLTTGLGFGFFSHTSLWSLIRSKGNIIEQCLHMTALLLYYSIYFNAFSCFSCCFINYRERRQLVECSSMSLLMIISPQCSHFYFCCCSSCRAASHATHMMLARSLSKPHLVQVNLDIDFLF